MPRGGRGLPGSQDRNRVPFHSHFQQELVLVDFSQVARTRLLLHPRLVTVVVLDQLAVLAASALQLAASVLRRPLLLLQQLPRLHLVLVVLAQVLLVQLEQVLSVQLPLQLAAGSVVSGHLLPLLPLRPLVDLAVSEAQLQVPERLDRLLELVVSVLLRLLHLAQLLQLRPAAYLVDSVVASLNPSAPPHQTLECSALNRLQECSAVLLRRHLLHRPLVRPPLVPALPLHRNRLHSLNLVLLVDSVVLVVLLNSRLKLSSSECLALQLPPLLLLVLLLLECLALSLVVSVDLLSSLPLPLPQLECLVSSHPPNHSQLKCLVLPPRPRPLQLSVPQVHLVV